MRSFGVGRSTLESLVAHEVMSLIDSYKRDVGKAMEIDRRLDVAVMNVVWKICTGIDNHVEISAYAFKFTIYILIELNQRALLFS
jgi:hypothetical protein